MYIQNISYTYILGNVSNCMYLVICRVKIPL